MNKTKILLLLLITITLFVYTSSFSATNVKGRNVSHLAQEQAEKKRPEIKKQPRKSIIKPHLFPPPIIIAPYLIIDTDALITLPTYNQDVRLLKLRQALTKNYDKLGLKNATPIIEVSGKVEGQIANTSATNHTQTNLSSAELDIAAFLNTYVNGFAAISYDASDSPATPNRFFKSAFYLDRGFLTFGNFNHSRLYTTVGQEFLPFGQYNNFMISAPLTQSIGKTSAYTVSLGYAHDHAEGIYTTAYLFEPAKTNFNNNPNPFGITLGYDGTYAHGNYDIGIDYIGNIANSLGMQSVFFTGPNKLMLQNAVSGIDLHSKLTFNKFTLLAEYTAAINKFNQINMSFNQQGACPQALDVQLGYEFNIADKKSSFAIGYGQTEQALALGLPLQRYIATFNIAPWQNTIASLEYQHAINYPSSDSATLANQNITASSTHASNMLTFRFGFYF